MYDFDAIFIGSGHASWHGAVALAAAGKKVAVLAWCRDTGRCVQKGDSHG